MGWVAVGPLDRSGVFVVEADVAHDFLGQIGFGSKDAAGDKIALNFGEPDFDLVEPGGVGRRVVQVEAAMLLQEGRDGFGFVSRKIVQDEVDLALPRLGREQVVQKSNELGRWYAVPWSCRVPPRSQC
jgi:hypothetical protein